jgi:hypothetical protein
MVRWVKSPVSLKWCRPTVQQKKDVDWTILEKLFYAEAEIAQGL